MTRLLTGLASVYIALSLLLLSACDSRKSSSSVSDGTYSEADTLVFNQLLDSANACYLSSRPAESLAYAREAAQMAYAMADSMLWADALSCQLACFQRLGIWDSSIVIANRLLDFDLQDGDPALLASDYHSLAAIYYESRDLNKAREFVEQAIAYEVQDPTSGKLPIRYGLACEIYNQLGLYEQAIDYGCKAYQYDSISGNALGIARRLAQQSDVYASMDRLRDAERLCLDAVQILDSLGEKHSLALSCKSMGNILMRAGRREDAGAWLERAVELSLRIGEPRVQADAYLLLSKVYGGGTNPTRELECLQRYTQLHDSLLTADKLRALTEFVVRYDSQRQSIQLQQQSASLHSWRVYVGWLVGILLSLIAVVLVRHYHAVRRERVLARKVEYLEQNIQQHKQQEHTDANSAQSESVLEPQIQEPQRNDKEKEFLRKVDQFIVEQMDKSDLSAESIASRMCISSQKLRRRLQALTGQSASAYITNYRIEFSKSVLLNEPQLNINEVASRCGFEEPGNFSRAFKNKVGMSPKEFRKMAQSGN